jgi:hypothetical protein
VCFTHTQSYYHQRAAAPPEQHGLKARPTPGVCDSHTRRSNCQRCCHASHLRHDSHTAARISGRNPAQLVSPSAATAHTCCCCIGFIPRHMRAGWGAQRTQTANTAAAILPATTYCLPPAAACHSDRHQLLLPPGQSAAPTSLHLDVRQPLEQQVPRRLVEAQHE